MYKFFNHLNVIFTHIKTLVHTVHYNSVFCNVRIQSLSAAYMPVCDELDNLSHVTHITTANSWDVKKQKVVGKRCIGSSVDRQDTAGWV
jgi:predicted oxidoreductase